MKNTLRQRRRRGGVRQQSEGCPGLPRSYLLELGFKTLLIIRLTIARQLIGGASFRFTEDREFRPEEIEIARA
jgi:hypothetical protein